jgi:hypothetical protein
MLCRRRRILVLVGGGENGYALEVRLVGFEAGTMEAEKMAEEQSQSVCVTV